jgi:hypothetical protein
MKYLCDIEGWSFKKNVSLENNVAYWSRRLYRESVKHKKLKAESCDMATEIYHGVTAFNKFQTARMLKTIAQELKKQRSNGVKNV